LFLSLHYSSLVFCCVLSDSTYFTSQGLAKSKTVTSTLAIYSQTPGQDWGRWPVYQQQNPDDQYYAMPIPGPYDSRIPNPLPQNQYSQQVQYLPQPHIVPSQHAVQHNNPFNGLPYSGTYAGAYSGANVNAIAPSPQFGNDINYIRPRPLFNETYDQRRFVDGSQPRIKVESQGTTPTRSPVSTSSKLSRDGEFTNDTSPSSEKMEVDFATEVDVLMKAIQGKPATAMVQEIASPLDPTSHVVGSRLLSSTRRTPLTPVGNQNGDGRSSLKKYCCSIENCTKRFSQKTHLSIHKRSHTGDKPYVCYHSCFQQFQCTY